MNYIQTKNESFIHNANNANLAIGGNPVSRVLDGFLLTEHERNIYEVFEPTINALAMPVNDRIRKLEKYLATLDQVVIGLEHEFIDGLYKRTMTVPAGTVLTGAVHKVKHMDVMTEGSMLVVTEDGTRQIDAPFTMTTQEGIKKCGIALTDVTWCTFHAAPYDTIKEMEAHIHTENDKDLHIENDDYAQLLNELKITDAQIKAQSYIEFDMVEMTEDYNHIFQDKSLIEGIGLFTSKNIEKHAIICPVRIKGMRTIAGRYANHSDNPNTKPLLVGQDIYYKALESITPGSELTINYRDMMKINPDILNEVNKCLVQSQQR